MQKINTPKSFWGNRDDTPRPTGMVYIMTNSAGGNEAVALRIASGTPLTPAGRYNTGGAGTGMRGVSSATPEDGVDPLASQGSLALSRDKRFLFAVNAGSGSVSSFRVSANGTLSLAGIAPAGVQPNCLDSYGSLLYVAHVGSAKNGFSSGLTGYRIGADGRLSAINGSRRNLSVPDAQPARVVFSPSGRQLVVSELTKNRLSVFGVGRDGLLTGPVVNRSGGQGPFGSYFIPSCLLVAEAISNALTSYRLSPGGMLNVISSVKSGQMATCWVVSSPDARYAYTSNAASGTITAYRVIEGGELRLLSSVQSIRGGMGATTDIGISADGRNLYALNGNRGSVSVFRIGADGRPMLLYVLARTGLPALGSQGIAVL